MLTEDEPRAGTTCDWIALTEIFIVVSMSPLIIQAKSAATVCKASTGTALFAAPPAAKNVEGVVVVAGQVDQAPVVAG